MTFYNGSFISEERYKEMEARLARTREFDEQRRKEFIGRCTHCGKSREACECDHDALSRD